MSTLAEPSVVNPGRGGRELHVRLENGRDIVLSAEKLRAACRCAHCRRAQIDGVFPDRFEAVTVTSASPMGQYGVNIAFSDGHARGIFPFIYLVELAAAQTAE
jgi:prepilin-type processing-associated H-X9-DG protein